MCELNIIENMKETNNSKKVYERPWTELVVVEMEGYCAGSTTNYDNAGSAGEGDYSDGGFGEFELGAAPTSASTTETFETINY